MTDTPELVTLKPLPIPPGHSDGEMPVDAGTYSPTADQTYREANESQWTRTRFTYCLLPGVNCPPDAAQRAARWGAGVTNSDADQARATTEAKADVPTSSDSETAEPAETEEGSARGSRDNTHESTSRRESSSGDANNDEGPSGGASNEFGTVLGTGSTNTGGRTKRSKKADHSDSPSSQTPQDGKDTEAPGSEETTKSEETATDETEDELTDDERRFLKNVIKALNGELDGYELTDSMTTIRNRSGSTVDEDSLVKRGYIENPYVGTRKYYYVTEKGKQAVDRKLYAGRDLGDLHEKVHHKVFTECFARYLEVVEGQSVEKYYEPMGGGMVFDVAGFIELPGGQRNLTAIGEVITQVKPERVVKHYDDFAQYDRVSKHWIVKDITVAHDLVRALHRAGRIETVPSKAVQKHTRIAEVAFDGNDEWQIHGGSEIIETVRGFASETRESSLD
jgi:hypothetical protein